MSAGGGRTVDLHTHTYFSDGSLSPEELVEEAMWRGLSAVALTDHDSVEGLPRAQAASTQAGLELVPGVELSCAYEGRELHLLGLFIAPTPALTNRLTRMRAGREKRMLEMIERLTAMGIKIDPAELPRSPDGAIGRPHLARLLIAKGVVHSLGEAFARYLGDNGPAYVPKQRFAAAEGVAMLQEAGGVVVVAHPGASGLLDDLPALADLGIDGCEAYYPRHAREDEARIVRFCLERGLAVCGGSDFHGNDEGPALGVPRVGYEVLEGLRKRRRA